MPFFWRNVSLRKGPDFPWAEARGGWQTSPVPSAPAGTQPSGGEHPARSCFPESSGLLSRGSRCVSQGKSRPRCSGGGFPATAPSPSHGSGASLPRGTARTPREQTASVRSRYGGPRSMCARKHCPAASQRRSLEGPRPNAQVGLTREARRLPRSPRPTRGVCRASVVSGPGSPRARAAFASESCVGEENPRHARNDRLNDRVKENTHRECPIPSGARRLRTVQPLLPHSVLGDPFPGVPRPCWVRGSHSLHQLRLPPDVHTRPLTNVPPAPPLTPCRPTHGVNRRAGARQPPCRCSLSFPPAKPQECKASVQGGWPTALPEAASRPQANVVPHEAPAHGTCWSQPGLLRRLSSTRA